MRQQLVPVSPRLPLGKLGPSQPSTVLYCKYDTLLLLCRLLSYLADALNPTGSGRNLFFAYNTDLTLSTQVGASVVGNPHERLAPLGCSA